MKTSNKRYVMILAVLALGLVPLFAQGGSNLDVQRIPSSAIAANLIGDPAQIEVAVYTPPNYGETQLRYPVLYLLHGIGGTYRDWTNGGYQGLRLNTELDSLIGNDAIPPLIVVMPTAMNRYWGSYYADSPVTGRWGEFMTRELIEWVDTNYRTLPGPGGRGIAGHSMGGFGALTLAMENPDVYSTVYALSPCCLQLTGDLGPTNSAWQRAIAFDSVNDVSSSINTGDFYPVAIIGLMSLATPNISKPPFFVDLPYRLDANGATVPSEPAYTRFRSFFSMERVEGAADALRRLRGLALDVGDDDQFTHIVPGTLAYSQKLGELAVPHDFMLYDGDHRQQMRSRFTTIVLPFFEKHLDRAR